MYRSGDFGNALHDFFELLGSDQESTSIFIFLLFFFDELFGNEMMRLSRLSIMLESSVIMFMTACPYKFSSSSCDSLIELGQISTSTIFSRFPEACLKRRNSCALKYFGVLHLVLSRRKLSCAQFSSPFFQRGDWYVMMA